MKKIFLIINIALLFVSCNVDSFLDEKYPPENPWQTVDQFEMAVVNPYSTFFRTWKCPWGIYSFYDILATDMGQMIPGQTGNFPWNEFYNRKHRTTALESPSAGWINDAYYSCYKTILACNDPLEYLENGETEGVDLFPKDSEEVENENIPRAKAELLFWRGYSYMYLALLFTPPYDPEVTNSDKIIPLKTTPINPQNTPIGSADEIWEQIISDLELAKGLMPEEWHLDGRVDYYTICGALARAYFYTGDYSSALVECNEIINSNKYTLQGDVMAAWNSAPGDQVASEVIWNSNPNIYGGGVLKTFTAISRAHYLSVNGGRGEDYKQCSWVMPVLSNTILKKLDWMVDPENGDYTETSLAKSDSRYGSTWFRLEGYLPKDSLPNIDNVEYKNTYESTIKTLNFPHIYLDKFFRGGNGAFTRTPAMRVAEFYLMRAALNFENGDLLSSAADLNVIRKRAGLSEIGSGEITLDAIDREWIIELGGEGLYLPYLMALRRPISSGDRGTQDVLPPYSTWYWHIPISEVNLNGGYKGFDPNAN